MIKYEHIVIFICIYSFISTYVFINYVNDKIDPPSSSSQPITKKELFIKIFLIQALAMMATAIFHEYDNQFNGYGECRNIKSISTLPIEIKELYDKYSIAQEKP